MKYEKGTFTTVPNKNALMGQPVALQCLFMWICSFADENGQCFPSRAKLAKLMRVAKSTVDRHMKELVSLGFIEKEERRNGAGKTSNLYQIMIIEGVASQDTQPHSKARVASSHSQGSPINELGVASKEIHELNTSITKPNNKKNIIEEADTIEIETNKVIGLFSTLNADWKSFFKPGYQRTQAQKLIGFAREAGVELEDMVKIAKDIRGIEFLPQIFSPDQMVKKWDMLFVTSKKKPKVSSLSNHLAAPEGKYDSIKSTKIR